MSELEVIISLELHKVYTGANFNIITEGRAFVKLTNKDSAHNDFSFFEGINVDSVPFNPHDECTPGGIYFVEKKYFINWLQYNENTMEYVWDVKIPNDARVYVENYKFKSDRIELYNKRKIEDMDIWNNMEMKDYKRIVKKCPLISKYLKTKIQDPEFYKLAVENDNYNYTVHDGDRLFPNGFVRHDKYIIKCIPEKYITPQMHLYVF